MTEHHRATPEQWAHLQEQIGPPYWDTQASPLLGLRARVEALQATQHAPTTTEARPGGLVERVADVFLTKTFTADDPVGARAAIREVAQTLRASFFEHAADWLEQEADRG